MPKLENSTSGNDTLRTSKTLREKAEVVKRCFINIVKCFRLCKSKKSDT